ncbi:hypothetical protein A3F29_04320 [Candidatus Roizmanbacteria bacterium RIFCSPHIGHO2_12_FULL_33_9]|uniref:Transport permease protein n=1 Tax=Candidatus Roizmanbacteria bacterium RIFCSPHIGHO2_12_FULL_33_9 TaxID=1802045 RepID=A0A1F7HIR0_9BACT|nr:MAG: hypothetical protein A3F29_04320 [Candidatus Roizmanbacteria bacterium RIFCSPHIGHO2_12_FULL_33_9]
MISWRRVKSILLEEYFISKRSLEIFFDIPFFAFTSLLLAGFIASFISSSIGIIGAQYLILGMILWECLRITQYSMSVSVLWEIWSRNLSNIFISPISIVEYFISLMISSILKITIMSTMLSLIAFFFFKFNILEVGLMNLILILFNLVFFGWSTGIIILGLIFRFSTRVQAIAWGIIFLFQPLTAALYPISILPSAIQKVAFLFPPTYVFEAAREALRTSNLNWEYISTAFILNIVYLIGALILFKYLFKSSKDMGQFARNEG